VGALEMSKNWIIAGVAAVCFITGVALSQDSCTCSFFKGVMCNVKIMALEDKEPERAHG